MHKVKKKKKVGKTHPQFVVIKLCTFFFLNSHPSNHTLNFTGKVSPIATLQSSTLTIFGTFNCNPENDLSQQYLQVQMNGRYITKKLYTTNSGMCFCPNCLSALSLEVPEAFLNEIYRINNTNSVVIGLDVEDGPNFVCISKVVFRLCYQLPDFEIVKITPNAGPGSGQTNISIEGKNFITKEPMYC